MYKFRKLTGKYRIEVANAFANKGGHVFSSMVALSASYQNMDDCYLFEISSREETLLDGNPPTELMDLFMLRLSSTYYPMRLKVSVGGDIMDVYNFDEIRGRWEREADVVLKELPGWAHQRYITLMKGSMVDKASFLRAIRRDSFVQFYFLGGKETWDVACHNFPRDGEVSHFRLHGEGPDTGPATRRYALLKDGTGKDLEGNATVVYSENMDVMSLEATFKHEVGGEPSMRTIILSAIERKAKNANKVASFLFD
jgi:hypothetical protein